MLIRSGEQENATLKTLERLFKEIFTAAEKVPGLEAGATGGSAAAQTSERTHR